MKQKMLDDSAKAINNNGKLLLGKEMQVELVKVASSNLAAIGYDPHSQTMRVLFQEGSTYEYYGVPASLHRSLMKASSKGQFFKEHVLNRFAFQKLNLREERIQMGQNKQQKQAAERAAKAAATTTTSTEPPKPEPAAAAPAAVAAPPSKQEQTIAKLREGWTEKKVDLSKLAIKDDGKFKVLVVAEGWPNVQIGPTGGITVVELRSYQSAFDAALNGKELFDKQKARDAKKSAAPPASTPAPAPAATEQPKPESTTQRKKRQDAAVEAKLQSQSA